MSIVIVAAAVALAIVACSPLVAVLVSRWAPGPAVALARLVGAVATWARVPATTAARGPLVRPRLPGGTRTRPGPVGAGRGRAGQLATAKHRATAGGQDRGSGDRATAGSERHPGATPRPHRARARDPTSRPGPDAPGPGRSRPTTSKTTP